MFKSIDVWDENVVKIGTAVYFWQYDHEGYVFHGYGLVDSIKFDVLKLTVRSAHYATFNDDGFKEFSRSGRNTFTLSVEEFAHNLAFLHPLSSPLTEEKIKDKAEAIRLTVLSHEE